MENCTRKTQEEQRKFLIDALLAISNEEEAENFLDDLCTTSEIQDLSQRVEVARLLRKQVTYNEITKLTGASTATISRVNSRLMYGVGGYAALLNRVEEDEDD